MPPQQTVFTPGQTPPPANTGQYDFITNAGNHKSGGIFSAATPMKTRIIVVAGGGLVLVLLAIVFAALLSNSSGNNGAALLSIAQRQAELARISQASALAADEQSTQNFAATMYTSLLSEQRSFVQLLTREGATPSAQVLAARKSAQTDNELATAKTAGTYDQTYISVAQTELNTYILALKQAYASTKSLTEKQLLQDAYNQAQLLLTMSKQ